jgi:hypothetical protein
VQVGILGPLEVRDDAGTLLPVSGARLRTLLIRLAIADGRAVSVDRLAEDLWDGQGPADAANAVQALVSRLRGQHGWVTRGRGNQTRIVVHVSHRPGDLLDGQRYPARHSPVQRPYHQRLPAYLGLQLAGRTRRHHLAVVDHRHLVGQLVGLVQILGGEQDGSAAGHDALDGSRRCWRVRNRDAAAWTGSGPPWSYQRRSAPAEPAPARPRR